jgi:predicted nucleic acid-binding protein
VSAVLPDTSAWIAFLRRGCPDRLKESMQSALIDGRIHTCWVVRAELLIGARDEAARQELDRLLAALPHVELGEEVWAEASRTGLGLRLEGQTVPLTDLVIAQAAASAGLELWHLDAHYELIAGRAGVTQVVFERSPPDT